MNVDGVLWLMCWSFPLVSLQETHRRFYQQSKFAQQEQEEQEAQSSAEKQREVAQDACDSSDVRASASVRCVIFSTLGLPVGDMKHYAAFSLFFFWLPNSLLPNAHFVSVLREKAVVTGKEEPHV